MRFVIHRIIGGPDSVCVDDVFLHTAASFEDYLEADSAVYWLEDETDCTYPFPGICKL